MTATRGGCLADRVVDGTPASRLDVLPRLVVVEGRLVAQLRCRWAGCGGALARRLSQSEQRKAQRKDACAGSKVSKVVLHGSKHLDRRRGQAPGQPLPVRAGTSRYQASRRRPCWVRCFGEAAPGRPRGSSGLERKGQGMSSRSGPVKPVSPPRCSSVASLSRTRRTGCTGPSRWATSPRHRRKRSRGHASHGRGRQWAPPLPSSRDGPSGGRVPATPSVYRLQQADKASQRPMCPERGAARQAAAIARDASASQGQIMSVIPGTAGAPGPATAIGNRPPALARTPSELLRRQPQRHRVLHCCGHMAARCRIAGFAVTFPSELPCLSTIA